MDRLVGPNGSVPRDLRNELESWQDRIETQDGGLEYIRRVNATYDSLAGNVDAEDLVELRLMRSLWAKHVLSASLGRLENR